ncbi:Kelch repeat-containing protein [Anaeromyxobacter dehalogenans]|nr:kelch repeat-containing protein [Anaeromyxobacter dehalogenans]
MRSRHALSVMVAALSAAAAALAGCTGGSSGAEPRPLAAALAADPPAFAPGAGVTLVPAFARGTARIEPDVGPVTSGGRYQVGPALEARTYRLIVEDGAERAEAVVRVPFAYRDAIRPLDPPGSARAQHVAVGLGDGRVLLATGSANISTFSWTAELYDATTGTSAATGELRLGLAAAAALRLADGRVLVAGGQSNFRDREDLAAVWDPADGLWTEPGALAQARAGHALSLLEDGRVLVTGGAWLGRAPGSVVTEELLDPDAAASRAPAGSAMIQPRAFHTATILRDGRVLVAGGLNSFSGGDAVEAELFDPVTESFALTGSLAHPRGGHAAVRLGDGRVLVVGGLDAGWTYVAEAELWDPDTGAFTPAGALATPRADHTATLLADGRVLVAGGTDVDGKRLDTVELWDPATRAFTPGPVRLGARRALHSATALPDGRVLVVGGEDSAAALRQAEVYE